MEKQKQKRLEAAGCRVGTPVNLSRQEVAQYVEPELGLSGRMRDQRDERN
jgi:hypothetical protein